MKKQVGMMIGVLALVGIAFSGPASAQVTGQPQPPRKHPGHFLVRALHDNVVMEVLTEITGKDADTVKADMQTLRMRALLESYGIDGEAFHSAMDAKMAELVNDAVSCGLITKEQASEIGGAIQDRNQRPPGPATGGEEE